MSNIPITSLPITNPLTGEEAVPIVQAGTTKRTTTGAISALPFGQGSTFASGISFITVSSSFTVLPSSRVLAAALPITLTDGGTSAPITIGFSTGTAGYVLTANGTSLAATFQPITSLGTVTSVGLSGGTTGLTISNSPITTTGTMTISGTLGVPNGGTGTTTLTNHGLVIGQGTSPVAVTIAGSAGQVLVGQGAAADPVFRTLVGDISMTAGGTANASNAVGHALLNLTSAQGLVAVTSGTTATQRLIASGAGITITNGDGSTGNPTVALASIAGLSVLGTAGAGTAAPGAITGATAGHVLSVNSGGTGVAFLRPDTVSSWLPQLRLGNSTAGATYSAQNGYVYGVGKIITLQALLTLTNKGVGTGAVTITNLPFAAANNVGNTASAFLYLNNAAAITGSPFGLIVGNGTSIILQQSNGTSATSLSETNINNNTTLTITITYLAA